MRFAAAWRDCKSEIIALAEIQRTLQLLGSNEEISGADAKAYAKRAEELMPFVNQTYSVLATRAESLGLKP